MQGTEMYSVESTGATKQPCPPIPFSICPAGGLWDSQYIPFLTSLSPLGRQVLAKLSAALW